ncbi:MAG: 2,3-bisphosphoglycerate-independent phosphoglycerate mutase [Deltaproteobacteria bacterium]|nr:2,3-bisphosphoglycerate-independent phosphoglycerate mutase [Deltaproteobacteria bacterium]
MAISPLLLIILDGWGVGEQIKTNAVYAAHTPNLDKWEAEYPTTTLVAHNGAVGLPAGQMGNSEVGHLNIGAGRVVYQNFTRINTAIERGELEQNPVLINLLDKLKGTNRALHLLGLVSDGGVHSHINHLKALVRIAVQRGLSRIFIHCFMDGRDTAPQSGGGYMEDLEDELAAIGGGRIATVSGRYYAMDRDNRWDRVERAWQALVDGQGVHCERPGAAITEAYAGGQTDEFIKPVVITANGAPVATIDDGDGVLFFNFRADRARQLAHAFTDKEFSGFKTARRPILSQLVTCTSYEKNLAVPVLFPSVFPSVSLDHILGEEVSRHNLRQLRIAETEKYAHVTYFFNGGREQPFPLEDRALLNSPQEVATYDLKPEMSAFLVTEELERRLRDNPYSLVVLNLANGDMVGHSGILAAAVRACEVVDICLGRLIKCLHELGGTAIITADHGNADIMYDKDTNGPHTAHTTNPVPFILIGGPVGVKLRAGGALCDIAPTALELLGLDIPTEMTGRSLLTD